MKTMKKRLLALTLSVALLISCTLSGLVLPAAAEQTTESTTPTMGENLFANGDFEGDEWENATPIDAKKGEIATGEGYGGSNAFCVMAEAGNTNMPLSLTLKQPLEVGKVYYIRFKAKGGIARIYATDRNYHFMDFAPNTPDTKPVNENLQPNGEWVQYQLVPFVATEKFAAMTSFDCKGILLYDCDLTDGSVYYDDFELFEYVPGMNVVPASDGTMLPYAASGGVHFFDTFFKSKNVDIKKEITNGDTTETVTETVTQPEATLSLSKEDGAWKFSNIDLTQADVFSRIPRLLILTRTGDSQYLIPKDRNVTISFRYKGEGAKAKVSSASAEISKITYSRTVEGADGWKYYKARFNLLTNDINNAVYFDFSGTDTILIDDLYVGESTLLELSDLTWTPNGTQPQPGTEMHFSATLSNVGNVDVYESTDVAVDFVAKNGEKTINLGSVIRQGGLKAGESVTLTTPTPWSALEGEWSVCAYVNTNDLTEDIGTQGQIRVAETALVAPNEALAGGFDTLVFSDDFDTANVDTEYTGDYGYKWYLTDLTGVTGDESDYHLTDDGIMLEAKNMNYNWLLTSMDAKTGAGWLGFTHGYLEFCTRFNHNADAGFEDARGPAIWSFPPETIAPEAIGELKTHVEMDWMEYWGDKYDTMHWTISMHEQEDNGKQWMKNENSFGIKGSQNDIGDGQWHTVGYRWEEGLLIAYLDGREIFRQTWGPNGGNPMFNVIYGEYRDNAMMQMDNQLNALILAGSEGWPLEIDYIRVWQKVVAQKPTVSISESTVALWTGEEDTLTAAVTPSCTAITWTSDNEDVATVENGKVTAVSAGTAIITATVNGGNSDTCTVTVTDKPTISIAESVAIWTGESATLTATVTPIGTDIEWISSDDTVATVDQNGKVTAVSAGTATITATVKDGNSATCTVTVADKLESFSIATNGLGLHFPKNVQAIKENIDGVRFGTRIDFGEGYKIINGVFHLPHNNEYYEVVSMGTILRRHEDGTDLTLENKKWISEAYNSTKNHLVCTEFTETYVVFAVNMMTKNPTPTFNAREYDARGYVQLNIDGVITTLYTDPLTDSVDKAYAREMKFDIIVSDEEENVYDNEA